MLGILSFLGAVFGLIVGTSSLNRYIQDQRLIAIDSSEKEIEEYDDNENFVNLFLAMSCFAAVLWLIIH